jgi:hypothetical protein
MQYIQDKGPAEFRYLKYPFLTGGARIELPFRGPTIREGFFNKPNLMQHILDKEAAKFRYLKYPFLTGGARIELPFRDPTVREGFFSHSEPFRMTVFSNPAILTISSHRYPVHHIY